MSLDDSFWGIGLIIFGMIIVISFIILTSIYFINTEITQSNTIHIYNNGSLIYYGKVAFVDIESTGATTKVIIYKQRFPGLIVQKVYNSMYIEVTP